MSFLWDDAAATATPQKTVIHDFANGLATWDRADSAWTTGTASPAPPANSTHWAGCINPAAEQYLVGLFNSLSANFTPGKVLHVPVYVSAGALAIYYADQDTTPSNQYEFSVDPVTAYSNVKDVSGTTTSDWSDPTPLEKGGGKSEWHNVYLYWHPDTTAYNEPYNTGTGTGDLLVQIYRESDNRPIYEFYSDWGDVTYDGSNAGLGFAVGGTHTAYIGNPEVGDPGAFTQFDLAHRETAATTIHPFSHADFSAWDYGSVDYRMTSPGELANPPPNGNDVVLCHPGSSSYSEMWSVPESVGITNQFKALPNYIADGERGRVWCMADGGNLQLTNIAAAVQDENDSVRCEIRWSDNRVRILEWVAGAFTTVAYPPAISGGITYGNWYGWRFDRSTPGQVTFHFVDSAGNDLITPITHDLATSLENDSGIGVIGAATGANQYWSGFEQY